MRRKLLGPLLLLLIIVAACQNEPEKRADDAELAEEQVHEEEKEEKEQPEKGQEEPEEAEYEINEMFSIVPIDKANEKVALLTIDDAPDKHALEMAQQLKEMDANAIFFVNGHFLETKEEKEVLKEIYDLGFVIGNHTYSHPSLPSLSESEQKEEIVQVNDMVEEITGERPLFFRAPFGENTDYSKELAAEEGMELMNWTYGYDWEEQYMSKEALTDIMLNAKELDDGANLLMHDREWTAAALADIVTGLREQGYEIVDPADIKTKNVN
ncbi:MAG TPA: polysaccharide deacetylase family protein [Virgibacillus sp.]|nr:polysaccharide deacetylase family protein [Virgibacillus sp.]